MSSRFDDWTAQQHLDEAARLLAKAGDMIGDHVTGNAPVGVIKAGVHAQIAQAKATLSVIEVRVQPTKVRP